MFVTGTVRGSGMDLDGSLSNNRTVLKIGTMNAIIKSSDETGIQPTPVAVSRWAAVPSQDRRKSGRLRRAGGQDFAGDDVGRHLGLVKQN